MKEDNNISFRTIWSAIMALLYFAVGYLVMFTPYLLPYSLKDNYMGNDEFAIVRIILGVALFLYGFFRVYRVIKYKK